YLPCVLRACFSLLSRCSAALRAVHSFPTRRSSDLLVLPLGEGAAQLGVARLLEVHRAPSFRATLSARAPGQGRKRQREQQCTAHLYLTVNRTVSTTSGFSGMCFQFATTAITRCGPGLRESSTNSVCPRPRCRIPVTPRG